MVIKMGLGVYLLPPYQNVNSETRLLYSLPVGTKLTVGGWRMKCTWYLVTELFVWDFPYSDQDKNIIESLTERHLLVLKT